MKKLFLLLLLALPAFPLGQLTGYCENGAQQLTVAGIQSSNYVQGSFPGCSITVTIHGTSNKPSLFQDTGGGSPLGNPFVAGPDGYYFFYVVDGDYDITISGAPILIPYVRRGFLGTGGGGGNCPQNLSTTAPLTGGGDVCSGLTLAIPRASGSTNGYLGSTDWTTFNNKQSAGNYITALTGDGTATGPGSVAFVLANVNSNVGTCGDSTHFPNPTFNIKGLVTACITQSIGGGSGGLGSVPWTTITPSMGTLTPDWTATRNGNVATISGAVNIPLPTPSGNAAGLFFLKIKNSGPTANPITFTGVAQTGVPQAASISANDTSVFVLSYDNTVPEWTGFVYNPTGTPVAVNVPLVSGGTLGPAKAPGGTGCGTPTNFLQVNGDCGSGGGNSPGTAFQNYGYQTGTTASVSNQTICSGVIIPPGGLSAGHVIVLFGVTDAGNNDVGIYNSTGTLVAHTGATAFASGTTSIVAFAGGTQSIPAGEAYYCMTSVNGTLELDNWLNSVTFFGAASVSSTTSGGVLNPTITPPTINNASVGSTAMIVYLLP